VCSKPERSKADIGAIARGLDQIIRGVNAPIWFAKGVKPTESQLAKSVKGISVWDRQWSAGNWSPMPRGCANGRCCENPCS